MRRQATYYGYCTHPGCTEKLPIPTWKFCMKHDTGYKIVNKDKPFIEIKKPDLTNPFATQRANRSVPKKDLHKQKPYKKFQYHFGYKICIPFWAYIRAETLIYDGWDIIGWQ